jgi:acyl-CoA thioester hydrolase
MTLVRKGYAHVASVPTRWADNDVYGHVNNVQYYAVFDTVINTWLIAEGGLDIHGGQAIGLCAESHCRFLAAIEFPHVIQAALRVAHLSTSSVRYELALFDGDAEEPAATGWFVHVLVDRDTRRPIPIPDGVRAALERLVVAGDDGVSPSL